MDTHAGDVNQCKDNYCIKRTCGQAASLLSVAQPALQQEKLHLQQHIALEFIAKMVLFKIMLRLWGASLVTHGQKTRSGEYEASSGHTEPETPTTNVLKHLSPSTTLFPTSVAVRKKATKH